MKQLASLILILFAFSSFGQKLVKNAIPSISSSIKSGNLDDWLKIQEVNLYGGGSLLSLVTTEDVIDESTSTSGSIGINFVSSRISNDLYFSYNGKQTVEMNSISKFGNSLMNPNLSGQSVSYSISARLGKYYGLNGSFQLSDQLWQMDSLSFIDASPFFFRLGLFLRPFEFNLTDNEIDFSLNVLYTHRSILGDFNNNTQTIEGQSITPRGYNGFDISGNFYFNNVQLIVQLSTNMKGDYEIPGFSGTQVSFGVNVAGEMLKLK